MKKKVFLGGVFALAMLWIVTGVSPLAMLVGFIAAGALPGISLTINPYLMLIFAICGAVLLGFHIWRTRNNWRLKTK